VPALANTVAFAIGVSRPKNKNTLLTALGSSARPPRSAYGGLSQSGCQNPLPSRNTCAMVLS
jgi:hypothetical protein